MIPTLNSEKTLEPLLVQLSGKVSRLVIADGGSVDGTLAIAAKYDARMAVGHKGRGHQLSRGASWAGEADWLLFIHADCVLSEDWYQLVSAHMSPDKNKAGYFGLSFGSWKWAPKMIEELVRARCFYFALPYGDQGLLISRQLYDKIGGYEDIPLFEDVSIARKLGRKRLQLLPSKITSNPEKFEENGYFRQGWRNFKLLRRYLKGESPESLLQDYK